MSNGKFDAILRETEILARYSDEEFKKSGERMKVHYLKTWPAYYKDVESGIKTFEIRKDDRDYQVGDILMLEEYCPDKGCHTQKYVVREVTYCLREKPFVPEGYVVMGIKPASKEVVARVGW